MKTRDAFRDQAVACAAMGSPFTARLCALAAERLTRGEPVADRLLDWSGDPSGRADAVPLRLAGALHRLVLDGADAGLAAVYPPQDTKASDDALWNAVTEAMETWSPTILERLESLPQTNEPQRSAALCAGFLTIAARFGLPLVTSELGASAGLNLIWDRFAYRFGNTVWGDPASPVRITPDWRGPPPPLVEARVANRAACDRAPVRIEDPEGRRHLLSFVWADQRDRFDRTEAAIDLAVASRFRVEQAEIEGWLASRMAATHAGCAHVVYHSVVWQYLDAATRDRNRAALEAAGARATRAAPLAWLRLEGDGSKPGGAITLTLWPGGESHALGRADYHGRWVEWSGLTREA